MTCNSGFSPSLSGTCVNTDIDFNNCGSVGTVCSPNYTSCLSGVCSLRPAVILTHGQTAFGGTNINADDIMTRVSLPLHITLFNYSSSNITVTSNGVSHY